MFGYALDQFEMELTEYENEGQFSSANYNARYNAMSDYVMDFSLVENKV